MAAAHVLLLPMPCQGHVIPLLQLSRILADYGCRITFVNTDFIHHRIMDASPDTLGSAIRMVSVPDGLAPDDDRNDLGLLMDGIGRVMPGHLEELIGKDSRLTWLIADVTMGFSFTVAKNMGLRVAGFWPASAATLWLQLREGKMRDEGIVDDNGWPVNPEMLLPLSPPAPPLHTRELAWNNAGDPAGQPIILKLIRENNAAVPLAETIICNTFHEIEKGVLTEMPGVLPVGPLLNRETAKQLGHMWVQDMSCMSWLDRQRPASVVYVAFGSFTIFDSVQFHELARALELCGRPFLWAVRPDLTTGIGSNWKAEFLRHIAGRGLIVSWVPQEKVLAHPSVGCFLSHCGWNSTMEGVRNGVPFLCWPYFTDQFINRSYVCNVWKNGLRLLPDEGSIVSCEEIRSKVEELMNHREIISKASALKDAALESIREGGSSYENLNKFLNMIQ